MFPLETIEVALRLSLIGVGRVTILGLCFGVTFRLEPACAAAQPLLRCKFFGASLRIRELNCRLAMGISPPLFRASLTRHPPRWRGRPARRSNREADS